MKRFFKDDIEYRIANLREAIRIIVEDEFESDDMWEHGYRDGRLAQLESELRFLENLIKEDVHDL